MPVQVNGRYLVHRVTGMQRYARELVTRLGDRMQVISPQQPWKGAKGHLWEQAVLPWRMGKGLLWSPSQTGPLAVAKQVVTIHDAAFVDTAYCFSRSFAAWYQFLTPRLARRVRKVITVSHFSQQRLADYCRVPAEKIVVVHSGVDPRFQPQSADRIAEVREQRQLPARYVLCVGSLEPRKNLARLLEAWRLLGDSLGDLHLVLAGAKGSVFAELKLQPPPNVVLPGYVEDDELPALYAGAEFFVFPSIYEGFGFPVVEAMACGAPVVCAGVTSLPEVAGDAALFVEPLEVESIAEGIRTMASDAQLRSRCRELGFAQAKKFDWSKAAAETWRVLEEAS